jgi:NADH:ubiquinone oxidoreductase subunit F (NADH-binding)
VSGAARQPGVYEIALGTPVRDVLALAGGGGEIGGVQAVLAGGFFGSWLAGGAALSTPAAPDALRTAGSSFGAGIFLVLPASGCGLAETARVVRYLAGQSAQQCGPCLNGLPAIADALEQVAFGAGGSGRGAHGRALRWLRDLFGLVEGRGACQLPDGVTRLVASALRVFADDVRVHERGPCLAARGHPVFAVPPGSAGAARPAEPATTRAREGRR